MQAQWNGWSQVTYRLIFRIVLILVAAFLIFFFITIYNAASFALRAENALHANLLVVMLVREYVDKNNSWPKSWQDLEQLPPHEWAMFHWPKDREKLQEYVFVDFSADIDQLALESPEQFVVIHSKVPSYPYDGEIPSLLNTIRQQRMDCTKNIPCCPGHTAAPVRN